MKIFKFLAVLAVSILCFTGCEDEEINYAFQDVSAPSDVKAIFDVAQDDTGTVTIAPSGEGASVFRVYFGDTEDETPVEIAAGETLTHVYAEGEYLVRVIAVGSTGLTSEFNQRLTIAFRAPENLEVNVDQPDSNPTKITVSASADYATLFDVYFGDAEDEEPTQLMPDGSIEHTYAAPGEYTLRVVAKGAGVATTEDTVTIIVPEAAPAKLPITFDEANVNYTMGTFSGTSFEVVLNPDLSGANTTESNVGALTNSGNPYEGGAFNLGTPVDFSGDNKTITMKMWSDVEVPVLLKFEGGVNGERQNEVVVTHGGTGWEDLSFNFATNAIKSYIDGSQGVGEPFVPTGQYETMVIFVDGPGTTAGTFYFDDIKQKEDAKPEIPVTFESATIPYQWNGFGAANAEVIANPDASGINTSSTVLHITKTSGAQTWAGASMDLAGAEDFSAGTIVKMKVWSPRAGVPILFKMENSTSAPDNNGNPSVVVEVITNTTVANEWEELSFDLTTFGAFDVANGYDRVIVFPDFGNAGAGEDFYFDDIELVPEASSVISLFSEYYDDVPVDTWRTDWSAGDYEEVTVSGNLVKHYTNLNYVGIETVTNQIDATSMTYFHTEIWTGNATVFRVKLVDFGADGGYQGGDDSEHEIEFEVNATNQWISLDIPLSEFTGLTGRGHIAQLIYSAAPAGAADVYVDNVYFHN